MKATLMKLITIKFINMQTLMTLKQIERITMKDALAILKKNNVPVKINDANPDIMAKARTILRDERKEHRTAQLIGHV